LLTNPLIEVVHRNRLRTRIERGRIGIRLRKARAIRFRTGWRIRVGQNIRRSSRKTAQMHREDFGTEITLDHLFWDGGRRQFALLAISLK
jgi:hypothetical protein